MIFTTADQSRFSELLKSYTSSNNFILYDQNTFDCCHPVIIKEFPTLSSFKSILIPAGDDNKTISSCELIWNKLIEGNSNKKSLLINIGGGMITDIGGFCAATFKRGIDFMNVPTSLLAMVDASLGGKTGMNFNHAKNQIGIFSNPKCIYLNPSYLKTLPNRELRSGLAEMIKHELLFNHQAVETIKARKGISDWIQENVILQNVKYKQSVVDTDPFDKHERQALNFGHTIGHAIESISLEKEKPLLHGESIMLGMIAEAKLSIQHLECSSTVLDLLLQFRNDYFSNLKIDYQIEELIPYLKHDKKNDTEIRFSLLENIGKPKIKVSLSIKQILHELA